MVVSRGYYRNNNSWPTINSRDDRTSIDGYHDGCHDNNFNTTIVGMVSYGRDDKRATMMTTMGPAMGIKRT